MFKNSKFFLIFGIVLFFIFLLGYFYIFTSAFTSQDLLSDEQMSSLKEILKNSKCDDVDIYNLPHFCDDDLDIFGMRKNGDLIDIYGVYSSAFVVKFKGYAYVISGGSGYTYLQISLNNDKVKIVNEESVSDKRTLSYFPFRYRLKAKFYDVEGVWPKFKKKIESRYRVVFDDEWTLSIDGNNYELFTFKNNDIVYKEKGTLDQGFALFFLF